MQIETHLEYDAILTNPVEPVHFALRLKAPEITADRSKPIAFSLVLDRSGSMHGAALETAKEAARMVVRNLRKDDLFALTVFDDQALTICPLRPVVDLAGILDVIDRIDVGGCTNLCGGWMLGRDELKRAPEGMPRRLLLLSDGQLNMGIVEPDQVARVVSQGLEAHGIRTSALGFGNHYYEDLLARLSGATNGTFYDAASAERLPAIFAAELDGLQRLSVQNLRIHLKRLTFCEGVLFYAQYPWTELNPEQIEITLGDLISGEERTIVFGLQLSSIPPGADGKPLITLDEEALIEVELLWDALEEDGVASRNWKQTIRARRTQDPHDVTLNDEMVPWIATQQAAKASHEAIDAVDRGEVEEARQQLRAALRRLKAYPENTDTRDGRRLVQETLDRLEAENGFSERSRKRTRATSRDFSEMSSERLFSTDASIEEQPRYKRRPPPSGDAR